MQKTKKNVAPYFVVLLRYFMGVGLELINQPTNQPVVSMEHSPT